MMHIRKSYSDFYLCQSTHKHCKDVEIGMGVGREAKQRKCCRLPFLQCPKSS